MQKINVGVEGALHCFDSSISIFRNDRLSNSPSNSFCRNNTIYVSKAVHIWAVLRKKGP